MSQNVSDISSDIPPIFRHFSKSKQHFSTYKNQVGKIGDFPADLAKNFPTLFPENPELFPDSPRKSSGPPGEIFPNFPRKFLQNSVHSTTNPEKIFSQNFPEFSPARKFLEKSSEKFRPDFGGNLGPKIPDFAERRSGNLRISWTQICLKTVTFSGRELRRISENFSLGKAPQNRAGFTPTYLRENEFFWGPIFGPKRGPKRTFFPKMSATKILKNSCFSGTFFSVWQKTNVQIWKNRENFAEGHFFKIFVIFGNLNWIFWPLKNDKSRQGGQAGKRVFALLEFLEKSDFFWLAEHRENEIGSANLQFHRPKKQPFFGKNTLKKLISFFWQFWQILVGKIPKRRYNFGGDIEKKPRKISDFRRVRPEKDTSTTNIFSKKMARNLPKKWVLHRSTNCHLKRLIFHDFGPQNDGNKINEKNSLKSARPLPPQAGYIDWRPIFSQIVQHVQCIKC